MREHDYCDREVLLDKLRSTLAGTSAAASALKTRREAFRISQHELTRLSGVSQAVISRIEAGVRLPTNAQTEKLSAALQIGKQDLGLKETMTSMGRLAAKGELPPGAAADFAEYLKCTQPDSEAARRVDAAVLEALVDIAETASEARGGAAVGVKSQAKVGPDTRGLRIDKPHRLPGQHPISDDRGSTGRRRRDAQGRVIEKSYHPLSWGM